MRVARQNSADTSVIMAIKLSQRERMLNPGETCIAIGIVCLIGGLLTRMDTFLVVSISFAILGVVALVADGPYER